jgi:hypothetical protein
MSEIRRLVSHMISWYRCTVVRIQYLATVHFVLSPMLGAFIVGNTTEHKGDTYVPCGLVG